MGSKGVHKGPVRTGQGRVGDSRDPPAAGAALSLKNFLETNALDVAVLRHKLEEGAVTATIPS